MSFIVIDASSWHDVQLTVTQIPDLMAEIERLEKHQATDRKTILRLLEKIERIEGGEPK